MVIWLTPLLLNCSRTLWMTPYQDWTDESTHSLYMLWWIKIEYMNFCRAFWKNIFAILFLFSIILFHFWKTHPNGQYTHWLQVGLALLKVNRKFFKASSLKKSTWVFNLHRSRVIELKKTFVFRVAFLDFSQKLLLILLSYKSMQQTF